jgi:phosphoribosyl 1,2-cyclic phosphodiesterase
VKVTFWGVRGSIPTPDSDMMRYGGNTSCVCVGLEDGTELVLDAGTGIRGVGRHLLGTRHPVHLLLTHLHLDHIMGLLFFAPFFDPNVTVTVWGPEGAYHPLRQRLARYLSAPLSPVELHELPAQVTFREVPPGEWLLAGARVRAALVTHRGTTLGYRISEGADSVCYLPDHEPALGQDLDRSPTDWVSGFELARSASLLIHDSQYMPNEYVGTRGWGHSSLPDALAFARRAEPDRVTLFHHDPAHDDDALDLISDEAQARWADLGGDPRRIGLAVEGRTITL